MYSFNSHFTSYNKQTTDIVCLSPWDLSVYDNRDVTSETSLSPSPPSSLTDVHRCISYRNPNWDSLSKSVRLTYLSVYDNRDSVFEPTPSPSPPSSLTDVHRSCIGYRNPNWHSLSKSVRLTNLSVWQLYLVWERFQFPQSLSLRFSEHRHLPSSHPNFRFIRCNKVNTLSTYLLFIIKE